jgi:hypothetical protein
MEDDTKYQKGKIYRLVCKTTGRQYIGSTIQTLRRRLSEHKSDYKRYKEGKEPKYTTSFDIVATGNYSIELVENYPCNNKPELERQERSWIEKLYCVNRCIPTRGKLEYYLSNRDTINRKRYKNNTCPCGGRYTTTNKSKHLNSKHHQKYMQTLSKQKKIVCRRHRPMAKHKRVSSCPPRLGLSGVSTHTPKSLTSFFRHM